MVSNAHIVFYTFYTFMYDLLYIGEAYGLIAVRFLIGFLQGPLHPAVSTFAVAWYPMEQRGRYCSVVFIGVSVLIFF